MTHTPRPEAPERIWLQHRSDLKMHERWSDRRHFDNDIAYTRADALRPAAGEVESCEACGKEYALDDLSISGDVRVCNNCLPCSYCEGKGKQFETLTMEQEVCLYCNGSGQRPAAGEGEGGVWSCGTCGAIASEVPIRFRVFGSCYPCAAERSIEKRNKRIAAEKAENKRLEALLSAAPKPPQSPSLALAEENRVLREALKEYMRATDALCGRVDWKDGARVDGETSDRFDRAEESARAALSTARPSAQAYREAFTLSPAQP